MRGFQGDHIGAPDHVLACAKHFAGYGAAIGGRDYEEAYISDSQMWNTYLPPFHAAVQAGVGSIMSVVRSLTAFSRNPSVRTESRRAPGRMLPLICDRTEVLGDFAYRFQRSSAGTPEIFILHGGADDQHGSCVERLLCRHVLRAGRTLAPESNARVICRSFSRRITGALTLLPLIAVATTATAFPTFDENDREHWVGTWAAAVHEPDLLLPGLSNSGFNNQTLRQIVHTSIGGRQIRVRLSAFGAHAVTIGAAHIALSAGGEAVVPGSDRALTFGGQQSITIPSGSPVVSDAVELAVPALSDLAVSLYVPGVTGPAAWHFEARQTTYISPDGDFTASQLMPFESTRQAWFWLSGIEVLAPPETGAIATFGDSTTDGTNSTADANNRWPDQLARRLILQRRSHKLAVLNAGLAGNRLLNDFLGPNGLARFERDVLSHPGVSHVIVLLGNADIGEGWPGGIFPSDEVSVDQIIQGQKQLIDRAHARGLKIYGGTLNPFEGYMVPGTQFAFFTAENEEKRQAVNSWIRTSGEYDGVIDFDKVLRDPNAPSRLLPAYDSGDHVHPTDDGYKAMADAIDLSLFRNGDHR